MDFQGSSITARSQRSSISTRVCGSTCLQVIYAGKPGGFKQTELAGLNRTLGCTVLCKHCANRAVACYLASLENLHWLYGRCCRSHTLSCLAVTFIHATRHFVFTAASVNTAPRSLNARCLETCISSPVQAIECCGKVAIWLSLKKLKVPIRH